VELFVGGIDALRQCQGQLDELGQAIVAGIEEDLRAWDEQLEFSNLVREVADAGPRASMLAPAPRAPGCR